MFEQRKPLTLAARASMQQLKTAQGMAMVEALVALVLLTAGVLGLLWMHEQALVQQRQQLLRSVAIGLADDLVERMFINPSQHALYAKTWATPVPEAPDCATLPCLPQDLAHWDLQQFQHNLNTQLPQGDASVYPLTDMPGRWGIVMAWRDTQETYRTDTLAGTPPCPMQMSCWRLLFSPSP